MLTLNLRNFPVYPLVIRCSVTYRQCEAEYRIHRVMSFRSNPPCLSSVGIHLQAKSHAIALEDEKLDRP